MSSTAEKRLVNSFGRRLGRKLRPSRQALVDRLLPQLSITLPEKTLDVGALFAQPYTQYWLEIGFGGGEHMAAQALANPAVGIIGSEPYINGLVSLLGQLEAKEIRNVRLFPDDVRLLLAKLPQACFSRVFILFPDPWPKARHNKRRLIQLPFLELLAQRMKSGAELRIATDHADYLTWMLEHLLACPYFEWTAKEKADWQSPPADWVRTQYQAWAETEGRKATYLLLRRV